MRTPTIAVFAAIVPMLVSAAWMAGGKTIDASHWNASGKTLDASLYVSANGGRYTADNAYASQTWAFAVGPVHSNAPAIEIRGADLDASAPTDQAAGSIVIAAGNNLGNGNTSLDAIKGAVLITGGANASPYSYGGGVTIRVGQGTIGDGMFTVQGGDTEPILQIEPHIGGGHDLYANIVDLYGITNIHGAADAVMIDLKNGTLHAIDGTKTISIQDRKLYDDALDTCLDWNNRNMIGDQGLGLSVATWTGSAFTVHTRLAIKRPDGTTLTLTPTNEPTAGAALRWSGTGCYWGP